MNLGKETEKLEFKKSTSELNEAIQDICAILNKHQSGLLYFGVKNNGEVVSQTIGTDTLRDISRKIYEKIKPIPTIEVTELHHESLSYIKVAFRGNDVPYSADGLYYFRVSDESREMTRTQLKELFSEATYKEEEWENTLTSFIVDDADEETLLSAYNEGLKIGRFSEPYTTKEKILKKLGLLVNGKLTSAGNVLFSSNKPIWLKMAVFATEQKITFIDMLQIQGNVFECIAEGIAYIKKHMNWRALIKGEKREDIPEIPTEAIREIVTNSFVHAKYSHMRSYHEIDIFPSKITIFNPGHLPLNLDPVEFVNQGEDSQLRNPKIAEVLYKANKIEAFGTGFARAFELCNKAGVKYDYKNNLSGFEFTFKRTNKPTEVLDSVGIKLNKTEELVLSIVSNEPYSTAEDIAAKTGKTKRTIERVYLSLQEKKVIERVGSKKAGYWRVIK